MSPTKIHEEPENENGWFNKRNNRIDIELPALATSVSAAEYDGDEMLSRLSKAAGI